MAFAGNPGNPGHGGPYDAGRDGGLPLDSFTRSCPPGWRPGQTSYPLRRYRQLLSLWWRQADLQEFQVGPAMAGRLRGAAFQVAMSMSMERYDLALQHFRVYAGDELLSCASDAGFVDPHGQNIPPQDAGARILIRRLELEFGVQPQDQSIAALDAFFGLQRGSLSLGDYLTMWRLTFDEAATQSGLQINNIGKSYLMMRASGLSERAKHDFRLQVGGDLNRFEDLMGIISRFSNNDSQAVAQTIPQMTKTFWSDGGDFYPDEAYWLGGDSWHDDVGWYDEWDCDPSSVWWSWEDESDWHDVSYEWDGTWDDVEWPTSDNPSPTTPVADDAVGSSPAPDVEEF